MSTFRWTLRLAIAGWMLRLLLLAGHVNLVDYVLNPADYLEVVRYSGNDWSLFVSKTLYGLFCAAFALAVYQGHRRKALLQGGVFIVLFSLTGGQKQNWFIPLVSLMLVKGFIARRRAVWIAVGVTAALCIGVPLAFIWRDAAAIGESGSVESTLLEYNEVFLYSGPGSPRDPARSEVPEKGAVRSGDHTDPARNLEGEASAIRPH